MSVYDSDTHMSMCATLGAGSYGIVKKTTLDGELVAVKRVHRHNINPLELSIMATYNSSVLNRAIYIDIDKEGVYSMYQEIAVCDLKARIKQGGIPESLKKTWTLTICEALLFLRKENIVHGDIKPSNVLVYENDTVRLSDFGCSALVGLEDAQNVSTCGTFNYSAPEVLLGGNMSHEGDLWSLGCLFYELMTGKKLIAVSPDDRRCRALALRSIQHWRSQNGDTIRDRVRGSACVPISFLLSGHSADLAHSILRYEPHNRNTLTSIMSHVYLRPENLHPRSMNVRVNCMMIGDISQHRNAIQEYLVSRRIDPPDRLVEKAACIYSTMSKRSVENLECSIQIAQKLYHYYIEHYHPITMTSVLCATEIEFYKSTGFLIHKHSFHDTYVDLEAD